MRVCPACQTVYTSRLEWCVLDRTQLIDQSNDPLIGTEIERYRIIETIGTGGLGRVYHAQHTFIERQYAIKVLYGDFAVDPKFQERFRREANSISKIQHPNVVRVEDFGATREGLTFLAMELLRGRTLDVAIREGAFGPERAANIVRQLLAGLTAAHDLGFVHRDVKPQNVMLIDEGNEVIKILDFGTVAMRRDPTDERLTGVGDLIGTPTYMAPEQCQDSLVGPTADLYAVGVILHELLTGSAPFNAKGRAELLLMHIMEPPPDAPPSLGLEKIVTALLKKEPRERPQTARAVIAMIDALELDLASTGDLMRTTTDVGLAPLPLIDSSEIQLIGFERRRSESDEFESSTVKEELSADDRPTPEIISLDVENDPSYFDDPTVPPSIETAQTKELDVSKFTDSGSFRENLPQRWLASIRAWLRRG